MFRDSFMIRAFDSMAGTFSKIAKSFGAYGYERDRKRPTRQQRAHRNRRNKLAKESRARNRH